MYRQSLPCIVGEDGRALGPMYHRDWKKAAVEANGGQPVLPKKTKVMVPPALVKVLENGNLGESSQPTVRIANRTPAAV